MSEHAADGSAETLPPAAAVVPPPPPSSSPPPPQPAAANASAANSATKTNALEPLVTLPPPSPLVGLSSTSCGGSIRGARGICKRDPALQCHRAGVAELADAPDSKSGGPRALWVRFPPPACALPREPPAAARAARFRARCCASRATRPDRRALRACPQLAAAVNCSPYRVTALDAAARQTRTLPLARAATEPVLEYPRDEPVPGTGLARLRASPPSAGRVHRFRGRCPCVS